MTLVKEAPPHGSRIFSCRDEVPEDVLEAAARHNCHYERTDIVIAYHSENDTLDALSVKVDGGSSYLLAGSDAEDYKVEGGRGKWKGNRRSFAIDLASMPPSLREAAKELVRGTTGDAP